MEEYYYEEDIEQRMKDEARLVAEFASCALGCAIPLGMAFFELLALVVFVFIKIVNLI